MKHNLSTPFSDEDEFKMEGGGLRIFGPKNPYGN